MNIIFIFKFEKNFIQQTELKQNQKNQKFFFFIYKCQPHSFWNELFSRSYDTTALFKKQQLSQSSFG